MSGAILPLPNTPSWRGAYLKHRDILPLKIYNNNNNNNNIKTG